MGSTFLRNYASESEDVLSAILTQSRDCIKLLNASGELEYVNANGAASFGADNPEQLLGRIWRDFWPAESRRQVDNALEAAAKGKDTRFEGYVPTLRGEPRWWDVCISPVRDRAGEITHILAISRDVTGQINSRLNDRLRREEAEREAGFAGDVAREMRHRLKNQLAVVGAVAKLLSRHTDTARDLALKLEEKLFSLARAQDLLTVHREQPVTARAAITQVLEASGAGEQIEVLTIPNAGLLDESVQTLALILGELQTNALKYGALRDEGGRIQLSGRKADDVLTLRWQEECPMPVTPTEAGGGGFQLIRRLGSAASHQPVIDWHSRGLIVEFNVRLA